MDNNEIDYKRAAEQLRNGEPLFGKDGALAPMLERILNAALEGEMDAHLSIDTRVRDKISIQTVLTALIFRHKQVEPQVYCQKSNRQ